MAGLPLYVCLVIVALTSSAKGSGWGYEGKYGPASWGQSFPDCDKDSQSPINIYEGDVSANSVKTPFAYKNYDVTNKLTMTFKNTGHGAQVDLSGDNMPEVSGGGLIGTYVAAQFHLHWSHKEEEGSEHKISSHGFPGEVHVVHYNKKYSSLGDAVPKADGLAVLGFMLELSETSNQAYDELIALTQKVTTPDSPHEPMSARSLNSFLPESFTKFYRYSGSLTTPPCSETVTWSVFKETIKMSREQVQALLSLQNEDGDFILHNARPVQPLNGREVEANFNPNIHWTYHKSHHDPKHWADYYESCGKNSQSPINIPSGPALLDKAMGSLTFNKFDDTTGIDMKITNNGHTVQVTLSGSALPSVSGGGLPEEYEVAQFHFHWGSNSMKGSEHTVDAHQFPMEVHVVMWKKSLGNIGNAVKKPEGLAVLGFFFEISDSDNADMAPIISMLSNIQNPGDEATMQTIALSSFLPAERTKFYRYPGSLTTPGCYQSVVWTVFDSKISISEAQMVRMRRLVSNEKEEGTMKYYNIVDNFRPVQALNTRLIKRNFEVQPKPKVQWTYYGANTGTQYWKDLVPMCGSTKRQSPIDIKPNTVEFTNFPQFKFKNFNSKTGVSLKLENNGHTAEVKYESGDLRVSGGGLVGDYKVAQFHFHWGSVNTQGSEHTVDGGHFPMEMHIVTYNLAYSSIGLAMTQSNGLAVLGFMFQVSDVDNANLEPLIAALSKVKEADTETDVEAFTLDSILPSDRSQFYRYYGSLTTPTCDETVTWTVFHNAILISQAQLNKFRALMSNEKDDRNNVMPLVDNYRRTQPIGERTVYSNFYISAGHSRMKMHHATPILSLFSYLIKNMFGNH